MDVLMLNVVDNVNLTSIKLHDQCYSIFVYSIVITGFSIYYGLLGLRIRYKRKGIIMNN